MALLLNAGDTVSRSYSYTQPSSLHPIYPQECGERTGNWFDEIYPDLEQGQAVKYKPIFVGDGDFTLSTDYPLVQAGTADLFLLSGNVSSGASTGSNGVYFGQSRTVSSVSGYVTIGYRKYSATHPLLSDYHTMLNEGSTAKPYEPYGYKIPISSAGQTTPVYLGEVVTTRKIKKLVLTGEENNWGEYARADSSTVPYLPLSNFKGASITNVKADIICTHYGTKSQVSIQNLLNKTGIAGRTSIGIIIADESISTLADFKAYLTAQYAAGTPVTVWYVLATPETAVVNEPLRKIGEYADSVSVSNIPTIAGANTLDVLTTLKPSEVTATYKGWHPVTSAHERENGAWT